MSDLSRELEQVAFKKLSPESIRTKLGGGLLAALALHPEAVPFERLYRKLPEEGMFLPSVSPARPFSFEIGAYRVPPRFSLMIFDMRPDVYRFSGIDPGDYIPVESRRFSSTMGFSLTVDQRPPTQCEYQIDPLPIQQSAQQAFLAPSGVSDLFPQAVFNVQEATSFADAAGTGTTLIPQRQQRPGARNIPFTIYAKSNQVVQVRCVVFRPLLNPIAFIEYSISGILMPESWVSMILQGARPDIPPSG